jgi:hypothetical protein
MITAFLKLIGDAMTRRPQDPFGHKGKPIANSLLPCLFLPFLKTSYTSVALGIFYIRAIKLTYQLRIPKDNMQGHLWQAAKYRQRKSSASESSSCI